MTHVYGEAFQEFQVLAGPVLIGRRGRKFISMPRSTQPYPGRGSGESESPDKFRERKTLLSSEVMVESQLICRISPQSEDCLLELEAEIEKKNGTRKLG